MEPPRDEPTPTEGETEVGRPAGGYSVGPRPSVNWPEGARLPIPGNAEWAMWFAVEILFAILWAASDAVDAGSFAQLTAIVTFAYLISRGIAKASRVLEQ